MTAWEKLQTAAITLGLMALGFGFIGLASWLWYNLLAN